MNYLDLFWIVRSVGGNALAFWCSIFADERWKLAVAVSDDLDLLAPLLFLLECCARWQGLLRSGTNFQNTMMLDKDQKMIVWLCKNASFRILTSVKNFRTQAHSNCYNLNTWAWDSETTNVLTSRIIIVQQRILSTIKLFYKRTSNRRPQFCSGHCFGRPISKPFIRIWNQTCKQITFWFIT